MKKPLFLDLLLVVFPLIAEEPYEFRGKHFLGSYLQCDSKAIHNTTALLKAMEEAVTSSGATVLDKSFHVFPNLGLTVVYLLSESHASLHTYPEFKSCFVDLFTCGDNCLSEVFDLTMRAYLRPKEVNARLFLRDEQILELE